MRLRKPRKGNLVFDIFCKPTSCDRNIDGYSNHPIQQKLSFIYSSIYQILTFGLLPDECARELHFLRNTCNNNLNPTHVVRILRKLSLRHQLKQISTLHNVKATKQYVSLPFNNLSQLCAKSFKKQGIQVGFYSDYTLQILLPSAEDKIYILNKSGFYKLTCFDCGSFCIGQTSRTFRTRIKKH